MTLAEGASSESERPMPWRTLIDDVREYFLLERALRAVSAARNHAQAVEYARAAEIRLSAAPSPADDRTAVVAITALRDAVLLLVQAYLASNATADVDRSAPLLEQLRRISSADPSAPDDAELALDAWNAADPIWIDRLPFEEKRKLAQALRRVAVFLRSRSTARSRARIRALRWWRLGMLCVTAFALSYWGISHLLKRENLALHQQVSMSSVWPGSAPPDALVDGHTSGARGPGVPDPNLVHTGSEDAPWVMIDLGGVRTLDEVRVYNRADHRFNDGLPYVLELSEDGVTFEAVARREKHFGSTRFDPPWKIRLQKRRARFVRIRCEHYVVLSEVEVFGR